MSPMQTRRGHKIQSSVTTESPSKQTETEVFDDCTIHEMSKDLKKRKKYDAFIEIIKDDNVLNSKRAKKLNRSLSDNEYYLKMNNKEIKYLNQSDRSLERIKSSKSSKSQIKLHTSKLFDSPSRNILVSQKCTKALIKSPTNLSSPKTRSDTPSRLLKAKPKRLTLTKVDPQRTLQKSNKLFKSNSPRLKLRACTSDIVLKKSPKSKLKAENSLCVSNKKMRKKISSMPMRSCANDKTGTINTNIDNINASMSMKWDSIKNSVILKEPVVVLQRLSHAVPVSSSPLTLSPSLDASNFSNKKHLRSRNTNKDNVGTSSLLHETTIVYSPEKVLNSTTTVQEFLNVNKTTLEPLMSSTPKDKNSGSETNRRYHESSILNTTSELSTHNALVTQAEINEDAEKEQDKLKEKDETYELSEPETPTLRKIVQETQNANKNNLKEKLAKKRLKVHFKDPISSTSSSNITNKTKLEKNVLKSPISVVHKQSNPISNEITSTVDPKFSAAKKIPNFAEIHKRMFAKLESVVDAKKRLKERHTALTISKTNNSPNFKICSEKKDKLSTEVNKGLYNRFGFKVRKREATECILRNSSAQSTRNKLQQQNRAFLKGVRTNRRFELQMKARNLNF